MEGHWTDWIVLDKRFCYRYEKGTRFGECMTTNRYIHVVEGCSDSTYAFVFQISHTNYLRCLYVNESLNHLICESVGPTLMTYVRENLYPAVSLYELHSPKGHQSTRKAIFPYLDIPIRSIFQQIIVFVCYLHTNDYSLNEFGIDDIRMSHDSIVKFCGIGFCRTSSLGRKRDFTTVVKIFDKLVYPAARLPRSFVHFRNFVKNCDFNDIADSVFLNKHLAIIPSRDVLDFMENCRNTFSVNMLDASYPTHRAEHLQTVTQMLLLNNWSMKFLQDTKYKLISDVFHFKKKGKTYVQSGDHFDVVTSLMRFQRNLIIHINDHLSPFEEVTYPQMDAILMDFYSQENMSVYAVLFDQGRLMEVVP